MKSKYVRLVRPVAWIVFLFPFMVGFGIGATKNTNPIHIIFSLIAFASCMSFSFIVNSLADKEVDKFHDGRAKDMNLSKQPFVTGEISEKMALYIAMVSVIISLFFAWQVNYLFFTLIIIGNIIGYIYSMPPTRFKTKPFTDILCNAYAAGIAVIAGVSIGGSNMNLLFILGCFIAASIFYIPTVVTDYDFDKKAGLKTSAVFFGIKRTLIALYPLTFVMIAIFSYVFITSNFELKISSFIIIVYTLIFVIAANQKFKDERLYANENWILVPFILLSLGYFIYGILKVADVISVSLYCFQ
jgi:4-hydroxybenzoate polyprenyltransferase